MAVSYCAPDGEPLSFGEWSELRGSVKFGTPEWEQAFRVGLTDLDDGRQLSTWYLGIVRPDELPPLIYETELLGEYDGAYVHDRYPDRTNAEAGHEHYRRLVLGLPVEGIGAYVATPAQLIEQRPAGLRYVLGLSEQGELTYEPMTVDEQNERLIAEHLHAQETAPEGTVVLDDGTVRPVGGTADNAVSDEDVDDEA